MSHGIAYVPRLFKYLPQNLSGQTILDVGCGLGEVGFYIKMFSGHPSCDLIGEPRIIGVEIYKPSVIKIRKFLPQIYDEIYHMDAADVQEKFRGSKITISLINSVLEHIEKNKALRILLDIECLADYILVSTPYGDDRNRDFGDKIPEWNHVSSWLPSDFTQRGYQVDIEETLEVGNSLIAKGYKLARNLLGTPIRKKIIAVRNKSRLKQSRGFNIAGAWDKE